MAEQEEAAGRSRVGLADSPETLLRNVGLAPHERHFAEPQQRATSASCCDS